MVLFFSHDVWLATVGILFCIILESDMCLVCVCVLGILVGVGACGEATGFHILTL